MYFHEPVPFHVAYAQRGCMEREQFVEKEHARMMSFAPERIQLIQKQIKAELDQMEYEGSQMYDEYPDKTWIGEIRTRIWKQWDIQRKDHSLGELIYMMILWEITRRRVKFCNTKKSILRF